MANAVVVISGVIGLTLTVPLLGSLAPIPGAGGGTWSPMSDADMKTFAAGSDKPVRISLTVKAKDAYLPESENEQFVWGVKMPESRLTSFKKARPDLFDSAGGKVDYPVVNLGYVMFSSICPHLGCKFSYDAASNKFACPCHGSKFDAMSGEHIEGPAPRGLDPLPFRESNGKAEITWIHYRSAVPDRLIVAYS